MMNIKPIIIIAGATATGKTNVAVAAARRFCGEIISADSMQVYKYMNIGTAKPSKNEMCGITHYLIDELYPDEPFNVVLFKEMAENSVKIIRDKGKLPVIAGGTGFYINALIKQTNFSKAACNAEIRQYYENIAETEGKGRLYDILYAKDETSARKIHPNNVKRVIRALEYYETTGESIEFHNVSEKAKMVNDDAIIFVLSLDRNELYCKIDKRVDVMISNGLVEEATKLLEMGYKEELTSMQGIGYKEIIRYLNGDYSMDEAIAKIKQASRNYAKRQVTWFKNQTDGIEIDASLQTDEICTLIENEINRRRAEIKC